MQKISLKPVIKELVYGGGREKDVQFDASYYHGSSNQEKALGSLLVLGYVSYKDDDLGYLIGLVSSLAKREYYSKGSVYEQDAKKSFERTLKKINEVLEDFFKNKKLKANIGLAAIVGENIFISRLGKFKVALARDGSYIDILNNIELFNKSTDDNEKMFSNIISGKLLPGDKLFAYLPSRPLVSREKGLNPLFVAKDQGEFSEKIAELASSNNNNFSCCGLHISMQEVKEIPIEFRAPIGKSSVLKTELAGIDSASAEEEAKINTADSGKTESLTEKPENQSIETPTVRNYRQESPKIIPAEVSFGKRSNIFATSADFLKKAVGLFSFGRNFNPRLVLLGLVVVSAATVGIIYFKGDSGKTKTLFSEAESKLKLAQQKISQNNPKEARNILYAALAQIASSDQGQIPDARSEINKTIDSLDKTSGQIPTVLFGNSDGQANLSRVGAINGQVYASGKDGAIFLVSQEGIKEKTKLNFEPEFLLSGAGSTISAYSSGKLSVFNSQSSKISNFSMDPTGQSFQDLAFYEDNVYALSANGIYKFTDAVKSNSKGSIWSLDAANDSLTSLAVDGNVYGLNSQGRLIKYFKGKKIADIDLALSQKGSKLLTYKDSPWLYLADYGSGKVFVFDKESGDLKTSYKLSPIGAIADISISNGGSIIILGQDSKIWQIKL